MLYVYYASNEIWVLGLSLENFEEIYEDTYNNTLMYIVCKCSNVDDINDLIQDTYVELYKILKKKKLLVLDNYQNYIIGIAKKKIQRYYGLLYKLRPSSNVNSANNQEYELEIPADIDVEADIVEKLDAEIYKTKRY